MAEKPTNQVLMTGLQLKGHSAVARTDPGYALEEKLTCLANGHSTKSRHGKTQDG